MSLCGVYICIHVFAVKIDVMSSLTFINRMKQVPVFFLSLYISPSACFSVTHDVLTHSRWVALAFFSPVYGHTAIKLNCPVTFQKFSCRMEPSQGLKDAQYVRFSNFKMPPQITYRICYISSYKRNCHSPLFS